MCARSERTGLAHAGLGLALLASRRGDRAGAADAMARGLAPFVHGLPEDSARILADGMYGDDDDRAAALALIDAQLDLDPDIVPGVIPFALIVMGEGERGLALAGTRPLSNDALVGLQLWSSQSRDLRRTAAFAEYLRQRGLVAFWDAQGPPDACRRQAPGEYACE